MKKLLIIVPALLLAAQLEAGKGRVEANPLAPGSRSAEADMQTRLAQLASKFNVALPGTPITASSARAQAGVALNHDDYAQARELLRTALSNPDQHGRTSTLFSVASLLESISKKESLQNRRQDQNQLDQQVLAAIRIVAQKLHNLKNGLPYVDTQRAALYSTLHKLVTNLLDAQGRVALDPSYAQAQTLAEYLRNLAPTFTATDLINMQHVERRR